MYYGITMMSRYGFFLSILLKIWWATLIYELPSFISPAKICYHVSKLFHPYSLSPCGFMTRYILDFLTLAFMTPDSFYILYQFLFCIQDFFSISFSLLIFSSAVPNLLILKSYSLLLLSVVSVGYCSKCLVSLSIQLFLTVHFHWNLWI